MNLEDLLQQLADQITGDGEPPDGAPEPDDGSDSELPDDDAEEGDLPPAAGPLPPPPGGDGAAALAALTSLLGGGPFRYGEGPGDGTAPFAPTQPETDRFGDPYRAYQVGAALGPYLALLFPELRDTATSQWGLNATDIDALANRRVGGSMTLGGLLAGLGGALNTGLRDPFVAASLPPEMVTRRPTGERALNPRAVADDWRSRNLTRVFPDIDPTTGTPQRVYQYESGRTVGERLRSGGALGMTPMVSKTGQPYWSGFGNRLFERDGDVVGRQTTAERLNRPREEQQPSGSGNYVYVSERRDRLVWAPEGSRVTVTGPPGDRIVTIILPSGERWQYDAETGLPLGIAPAPRVAPRST